MANVFPGKGKENGVQWLVWSEPAFDRAQREDKPVLLSISAVWCYWCHVMEETTYVDPDVVNFINENFVPVLVDNDHRPDINARYNVGGWPTTAFLTPHGGYIAGATYLPPDQLLAMLIEVRRAYSEDKPGLYDQAAQLQRQRQEFVNRVAAGAALEERQVDLIARRITGAYDARFGGFGEEPKFPSAPILQFLLHLLRTTGEEFYRVMLEKTLNGMIQGELYDSVDGGFFRYCAASDWTEAQHEKMLEDNINLARVFLDAFLLFGKPEYHRVASQTIDFLLTTFYDAESAGFRGSQGAHSEYFSLPPEIRHAHPAPPADTYSYYHWTLQAASLLLEAAWKLPRPELTALGVHLVDALAVPSGSIPVELGNRDVVQANSSTGQPAHVYDQSGAPSEQLAGAGEMLCDWVARLNALVDAYNSCPQRPDYLQLAVDAAAELDRRFYDPVKGGFFDTELNPEAIGYLRIREKPLPDNVLAATALIKLHQATQDTQHKLQAENTLSAFVEANRDYGEHAAGFATAVNLFLNPPVEITIEGLPGEATTQALIEAASRLDQPNLIIKASAVGQPGDLAQAHICLDTVCFPPVSEPRALADSLAEALAGQEGPTESIFERFAGF